jgi:periplasmic protein TonB
MQFWQRFTLVTTSALALHGAVLWAVHAYAVRSSLASIAPALSTRMVEPPLLPEIKPPEPVLQPAPRITEPKPTKTALPPKPAPTPAPAPGLAAQSNVAPAAPTAVAAVAPLPTPLPLANNNANPAPNAPTGSASPALAQPIAPSTLSTPVKVATPALQLPSADVEHADNQYRAPYPKMSQRLGEEGRVLLRVAVGADGKPVTASVAKSSGSDHLDRAGIDTVMRWRFKPGTRGGVPEAMSVLQPVDFKLPN